MKQELSVRATVGIYDPEVETRISTLEVELESYAKLQGKHDAERNKVISKTYYRSTVINYVKSNIQQKGIDFLRARLLIISMAHAAKNKDEVVSERNRSLKKRIDQLEHERAELERKVNAMNVDLNKMKGHRWIMLVALICVLADLGFIYDSLRKYGLPGPQALLSSAAIGAIIGFGHIGYGKWVFEAVTKWQRLVRTSILFTIVFALFFVLAKIRNAGIANTITACLDCPKIDTQTVPALFITLISFIVFLFVFLIAKRFHRTKQEKQDYTTYKELIAEIKRNIDECNQLSQQINTNAEEVHTRKDGVREMHEYFVTTVKRCINIGKHTVEQYKNSYARNADEVPDFFIDEELHEIKYDTAIQFSEPKKERA